MRMPKSTGATSRSTKSGSYSVLITAAVIAIAVVLNLIVNKLPADYTQFDISSAKLFTLSTQTEDLVSGLQQETTVYWVVQSGTEDSTIEHLLDRYQALSSNLTVSKIDPVINPTFVSEYTDEKISNNSLLVVSGTRSRYVPYDSIYLVDLSAYYQTGSYTQEFDGENALTSAIDYVVSDTVPVAYTLTGHGEFSFDDSFSAQITNQNIELRELDLLTAGGIPEDCSSLFLCSPKTDLSDVETEMLSAYLKQGGHLFLVTDFTRSETPNLDALLADYGVSPVSGMVIETDGNHTLQDYQHYILPDLGSHTITDPLTENGYRVLTAFSQGLQVSSDLRDGLTVTSLLTSTDKSYSKVAGVNLTTFVKEDGDIDGPFTLAAAISEEVDNGTTQIVWITSSYLFDSQLNNAVSGANYDLLLNSIGWLCDRESAISIHSKNMISENLLVPDSAVTLLSLVLVLLIPLALLITGIVITVKRRRR